ncbi:type I methionyl aminopeptidase [Xylanivirga thermophila]|uniref:type I methionyl aminopeptidase n=1 Tax=Xylanivirga thermophila TaxID=2496273 RepID=UPI00101BC330|nr:type I methionyl aminopeptidase [Xylanivirga thermophila]
MIILKSKRELEWMREAGKIVAGAHEAVRKAIAPGVTTKELDRVAEEYIVRHNATPAFKGYGGFPASICASINEQVIHGIPGDATLKDGDIISVDIGAFYNGYCGDAARTHPVGDVSPEAIRLMEVTEQSFFEGIKFASPGYRLSDISHAIQRYVERNGYSVVREFVGHGIGQNMHEDPQVPNYGRPGKGIRLRPGLALAVEPMVNQGGHEVRTLKNGWTVVTVDGSLSAHYENTIAITEGQPAIMTLEE